MKKKLMLIIWIALIGFVLMNVAAYQQAWRMTHYTARGTRTNSPEHLSPLQKAGLVFTGVNLPRPVNEKTPDLPYETVILKTRDHVKLEAWQIPRSNSLGTVILFHGYGSCKAYLLPEATAFHQLGYDVLLVDFRGSGGSDGNLTTLGYQESTDVLCAYQYVQTQRPNRPILLYGQSMGAAAILRAIAQEKVDPQAVVIEAVFNNLLDTVKNRFDSMGWPSFPFAHLLAFWGSVQAGAYSFSLSPTIYAAHVRCPALFLHGGKDPRARPEQARKVFAALPVSFKKFVLFSDAFHESCYGKEPVLWERELEDFLIQVPTRK
jgi:dipeptidyl aminopeptidase/acylaminoacyl peptidase